MELFTLCLHLDVSCLEFSCASVGGCKRYKIVYRYVRYIVCTDVDLYNNNNMKQIVMQLTLCCCPDYS